MSGLTAKIAVLATAISIVAGIGMRLAIRAKAKSAKPTTTVDASETAQARIERAMSAGPLEIARSAKIVDNDAQGRTVVLGRARTASLACRAIEGHRRSTNVRRRTIDAVGRRFRLSQAESIQHSSRHHLHACRRHAAKRFRSL